MKSSSIELVKTIFSKTGFHVVKRPKHNGSTRFNIQNLHYDAVLPSANYAPWLGDAAFMKVYKEIKGNTLVDIYRCYELWAMAEKVQSLDREAAFIEIGVWRGGTAAVVGTKLKQLNANVPFYLADTFTGVAKASDNDASYNGGEHADTSEEIVGDLLKNRFEHYQILKGIFPEDTAHMINNNQKFGYCHIDVDVYESAKDIVNWIWDKMIIGGVIVFDDYGFHSCDGVTKYVNEQKLLKDRMVIHNLNGHAVMIKLPA